mgnify:CR=1 FL=1
MTALLMCCRIRGAGGPASCVLVPGQEQQHADGEDQQPDQRVLHERATCFASEQLDPRRRQGFEDLHVLLQAMPRQGIGPARLAGRTASALGSNVDMQTKVYMSALSSFARDRAPPEGMTNQLLKYSFRSEDPEVAWFCLRGWASEG